MMEQSGDHTKMIATDKWIPIYLEGLKEGHKIKINPFGFSMYPLLVGNRDSLTLDSIDRPLKRGDICLYRRDDGKYVTHTIHHIDEKGTYFIGESQTTIEGPLRRDQILAVAESFERNGREYSCDGLIYRFFHEVWMILRPFRKQLIKAYRFVRRG